MFIVPELMPIRSFYRIIMTNTIKSLICREEENDGPTPEIVRFFGAQIEKDQIHFGIVHICRVVAEFYETDLPLLWRRYNDSESVEHLRLAVFLAKEYTELSVSEVADFLQRDYSIILYGIRKIERRLRNGDEELRKEIRQIVALLQLI